MTPSEIFNEKILMDNWIIEMENWTREKHEQVVVR
jgi:hypothetical protein